MLIKMQVTVCSEIKTRKIFIWVFIGYHVTQICLIYWLLSSWRINTFENFFDQNHRLTTFLTTRLFFYLEYSQTQFFFPILSKRKGWKFFNSLTKTMVKPLWKNANFWYLPRLFFGADLSEQLFCWSIYYCWLKPTR